MIKLHEAWGFSLKLSEWAGMFGIATDTLYKRLQRGMDLETALSMDPYGSDKHRRLTYKGETHTSAEWAEILGITHGTFNDRLRSGWPEDKVFAGKDLRTKEGGKQAVRVKEDVYVELLVCNALGEKPSVKRVKASEIDSVLRRYKYSTILTKRPKRGKF